MLALGGIVYPRSIRVCGDEMDESIIACLRRTHHLLRGEASAERINKELGSACPSEDGDGESVNIEGRDLMNWVPREFVLSQRQRSENLAEPVGTIIDTVEAGLENTAPGLAADITGASSARVAARLTVISTTFCTKRRGCRSRSPTSRCSAWRRAPGGVWKR